MILKTHAPDIKPKVKKQQQTLDTVGSHNESIFWSFLYHLLIASIFTIEPWAKGSFPLFGVYRHRITEIWIGWLSFCRQLMLAFVPWMFGGYFSGKKVEKFKMKPCFKIHEELHVVICWGWRGPPSRTGEWGSMACHIYWVPTTF